MSYERLLPFATGRDGELIAVTIERAESPYEPVPVAAVMDFFSGYAGLARNAAPDLVLKRNPNSAGARPEASRTIYFDAQRSGFAGYGFLLKEGRPASLRVSHQCWDSGAPNPSVKAMLDGWGRTTSRSRRRSSRRRCAVRAFTCVLPAAAWRSSSIPGASTTCGLSPGRKR